MVVCILKQTLSITLVTKHSKKQLNKIKQLKKKIMAFTIIAQPQITHPAYNPVVFGANDSDYTLPGYRYVFSFYESGESTPFQILKAAPNPVNGDGIVDVSKALQSYVSYDFLPDNVSGTTSPNSMFRYDVQIGYEYIVNWAFTSFTTGSGIYVNQVKLISSNSIPYSVGDYITIMIDPTITDARKKLNNTFKILEIGSGYIVIELLYSELDGEASIGGLTYKANGTLVSDYAVTSISYLNTFNAAYSFIDWKSYDANIIPMQSSTSLFLTDAPRTNFTIKPWQELYWNVYDNGWNNEYMVIAENSNGDIYKLPFSAAPDSNGIIQLNVGPDAGWQTFTEYPYSAATLPIVKDNTEWYNIRVTDGHCLNECDEVEIILDFVNPFPNQTYMAYRTAQIYNGKSVYEFFVGTQRYTIFFESYNNRWTIKQEGVLYNLAELSNNCGCSLVSWRYNDGIGTYSGISDLYIANSNFPTGHIQYAFSFTTPNVSKSFYVTYNTTNWKVTDYNTAAQVAHSTSYNLCPAGLVYVPETISPFLDLDIDPCIKDCPRSDNYGLWVVNTGNYPLISSISSNINNCNGEQTITETFDINVDHSCQDNETQIIFLDRMGSWSSFAFPLKVQQRLDNEKLGYRTNVGFVNDGAWTYNLYDAEAKTYHSNVKKQYNLTTHWLNDEMDIYFEELISSPVTYVKLKDSTDWLSCNVLTKSLEPITRRLKQRTITIELNSQDNINI